MFSNNSPENNSPENDSPKSGSPDNTGQQQGRPFVGVHMKCCRTYIRAYLNAASDAYIGRCPRCGSQVRLNIVEEGGSSSQFFDAS